jgi:hypothetical protein
VTGIVPTRMAGESDGALLDRLLASLNLGGTGLIAAGGTGGSTTIIYDELGRPLVTPQGIYSYSDEAQTEFTAPIRPNIVQINTQDLVDGAVTLEQTNIPTMVQANQAVIGSAIVLNLLAGEVEAVTANIDNLRVNNANILNCNVDKLVAGTISASGIYVGSSSFELDGSSTRLLVRDTQGSPVTRVEIGRLGAGSTNYGITIRDASGTTIFSTGSSTSINGAYIGTATIGAASIVSLTAAQVSAGTLGVGVLYAGAIVASQVVSGTFTGLTFQTASSGQRVVISASNNRLEAYDSSGNQLAAIGQTGLGGAVYAAANSPAFAAGYFTNSIGNVLQVTQTGVTASNIATYISSTNIGLNVSTSGSAVGNFAAAIFDCGHAVQSVLARNTGGASGGFGLRASSAGGGSGIGGLASAQGGYAFYAEVGGYGPFTAQHDALLVKTAPTPEPGDIMVDTDRYWIGSIDDAITAVELSSAPAQKAALGVYRGTRHALDFGWIPNGLATTRLGSRDYCEDFHEVATAYDLIQVNGGGEGCINVCGEGGDIARGDLIVTSSIPGKGTKQADDVVRDITVAKARASVSFASPSEVKQIPCVYLCS